MKKMINVSKKYWLDAIIIIGIWIFSYNIFREPIRTGGIRLRGISIDYHTEWKVFGILLIVIGLDVAIRRYIHKKTNK